MEVLDIIRVFEPSNADSDTMGSCVQLSTEEVNNLDYPQDETKNRAIAYLSLHYYNLDTDLSVYERKIGDETWKLEMGFYDKTIWGKKFLELRRAKVFAYVL